jgi:lysophospholipase L1-like esterase
MNYKLLLLALFIISLVMMAYVRTNKKKKLIFFGDSITELGVKPGGYITLVDSIIKENGLQENYSVSGSGISGNKVYDLYLRLEEDVLSASPNIVVLYVGVNDVWHKKLLGTGTDKDKFEKFYSAIIRKLQAGDVKAILCTPAVIGEKKNGDNAMDAELNSYSEVIRKLAKEYHLPLCDLRTSFMNYNATHNTENAEKGILTYDGVHLSAKGNELVAEEMWKVLK